MINIELKGRIPSKKNSKIMLCRANHPLLINNPAYTSWRDEQLWRLKKYGSPGITKCDIEIQFYFPDHRRTDLTNKAESIMDLLVDAKILKDDNADVVQKLTLISKEVDKLNSRAIITINEI